MKVMKKISAVMLVAAMTLSLAACGSSAKKITGKEFKKALEKEDYVVEKNKDTEAEEEYIAFNEEDGIMVCYDLFESKSDAKAFFNDANDILKEATDDEEFDGEFEKKGNKLTAKGTFEDNEDFEDGDAYLVVVYAEEMVITAYAQDNSKSTVKAIDKVIETLGY